jgi:predicted metal-binding membrane protein
MLRAGSDGFAAGLLLAAAIWQWSPLKNTCLTACRSPVALLTRRYRPGTWGALRMGMENGVYCLGCCWLLMALLFVGGVMNLYWIAGLSILVLLEKLLPWGNLFSRLTGFALLGAAVVVIAVPH